MHSLPFGIDSTLSDDHSHTYHDSCKVLLFYFVCINVVHDFPYCLRSSLSHRLNNILEEETTRH